MSDSGPPMSKIVVQTMIKGLEETKKATEGIKEQVHSIDIIVNTIGGKVDNMECDVKQLLKIIRDGNGQPALLTRVSEIETEQKMLKGFIEEQKNSKKVESAGKWQLRVAMVMGTLALIGTIGSSIINLFGN